MDYSDFIQSSVWSFIQWVVKMIMAWMNDDEEHSGGKATWMDVGFSYYYGWHHFSILISTLDANSIQIFIHLLRTIKFLRSLAPQSQRHFPITRVSHKESIWPYTLYCCHCWISEWLFVHLMPFVHLHSVIDTWLLVVAAAVAAGCFVSVLHTV